MSQRKLWKPILMRIIVNLEGLNELAYEDFIPLIYIRSAVEKVAFGLVTNSKSLEVPKETAK